MTNPNTHRRAPNPARPSPKIEASQQPRVLQLLAAVRRGEGNQPIASDHLANELGWPAAEVASTLAEAKAQLLLWWINGYGPGSRFDEIELTTQGRRLLTAHQPDQTAHEG